MNAIIGLTNILAMSEPLTQKQKDYLKTLQLSADSLLALINDLLDIAKIESSSIELEQMPFSLTQLVQEVVSMMMLRAQEKGLLFTVKQNRAFTNIHYYVGDPLRLRQILLNLCSNAVKFTETGGIEIEITSEKIADTNKDMITLTVKDTGIGIAKENLETIFGKFIQADTSINRKYGGTGLGLAITKTLTEIMGGTIEVESQIGNGSVFKIRLPLEKANEQHLLDESINLIDIKASNAKVNNQPHILLVEDYPANILVATTFLESFGYRCDVACNGIEAIEKVKSNDYALVLMDVQMPGMNGFDATKILRKNELQNNLPHLPIIGMTAHALAGDRERCIAAGMDDYIAKPFNPNELQEKLETLIQSIN